MIKDGVSFDGYRVEGLLGKGGMGVVYEATQTSLGRRVALKVLRPDLAEDPGYAERLRREGRMQAAIEHPNVLDVYEVGSTDEGLFLAMRLVDGPTLEDLIRGEELDAKRALGLLEQVAEALDAAHEAGLLHRDVKPQNVLVGDGEHAYLADFGLSRVGYDPATSTRPVVGTVAYVAPEVVRGEAPGPASDTYAFAATMFHCLTGEVPFPRGSDAAMLYSHASEDPPRISERRDDLPPSLDPVFTRALAKDPGERQQSAAELVAEVRRALGARIDRIGPPTPSTTVRVAETRPAASRPTGGQRGSRNRIGAYVAIAVVAAALGVGVAALGAGDDSGDVITVPPVPEGAEGLGSDLGSPVASVGCVGEEARPETKPCAIVQTELPDAQLLVPADGMIVGWAVRGAHGELALDVIRARGKDTTRVARSQWESAGNDAPFRFPAQLPVERGDLLGVELGPGASIGVGDADGATTERWFEPTGGVYGNPDRSEGTGLDREILLRADFVPGEEPPDVKRLTGRAAAAAPDGLVRARKTAEISKPAATVDVELVEVGDRVALDLLRNGNRIERVFIPDLLPGGQPVDMKTYTYVGEPFTEIDVWWVNPNGGRSTFHFLNVTERHIQFIG